MITLRTSAVDDNAAVIQSRFVAIPRPIGVRDGDLVLVAISIVGGSIEITPPDETWTRVLHTDPLFETSLAVYWKTALNERDRWVFALSNLAFCQGVALVYGGADGWEPVEASSSVVTTSSATQDIAAVSTSVADEEIALFVASDSDTLVALPTGYESVQRRQNQGTLSASHRLADAAGPQPATTATLSVAGYGASARIVLRPSEGKLSTAEVLGLLVGGFPLGVDLVYDLTPSGDYYKLFAAVAQAAKEVAFDLVDLLRAEASVRFARYKLPDWERVFGLTTTRTARGGTIPERQNQVISRWREAAGLGSTVDAIAAIVGPLLGYDPTTPVQVVTTDRELLDIEHSYDLGGQTIAASDSVTLSFVPVDGGVVSRAGARVSVEYGAGAGDLALTLTAPDGKTKTWSVTLAGQALDLLFGPELAGAEMRPGSWYLTVANNSGGSVTLIPTVLVEGVQEDHLAPRQITAAAMYDWGVYADPSHVGESGTPADFAAARAAVQRIAFSHTQGNLLQSLEPYPDEDAGLHAAIPDECIPT